MDSKKRQIIKVLLKNWEFSLEESVRTDKRIMQLISIGLTPLVVGWAYCLATESFRQLLLAFPYLELIGLVIFISIAQRYIIVGKECEYIEWRINQILGNEYLKHNKAYGLFFVKGLCFNKVALIFFSLTLLFLPILSGPYIRDALKDLKEAEQLEKLIVIGPWIAKKCINQVYLYYWMILIALLVAILLMAWISLFCRQTNKDIGELLKIGNSREEDTEKETDNKISF